MTSHNLSINRSGALRRPRLLEDMLASDGLPVVDPGDKALLTADEIRTELADSAPPIGTSDDGRGTYRGSFVLLDKLGGRLAFEAAGVRLYDGILRKARAEDVDEKCIAALEHIRDEECQHHGLLERMITELGGDPTMVTPCADVEGVMSSGFEKVVSDPRTTLLQGLHAALVAELADVESWTSLMLMMPGQLRPEIKAAMTKASAHEAEHVEIIRHWHAALTAMEC